MATSASVRTHSTRILKLNENLFDFILEELPTDFFREQTLLAVTSKLFSLAEGRVTSSSQNKVELVRSEADVYLGEIGYGSHLAVKHGLLMASAGIDESNSLNGDFILFPKDPYESAHSLCSQIKKHFSLKDFGVLVTDSHTTPLRIGVSGVALSFAGFEGIRDCRGQPDLFGRPLVMTRVNVADALSAMAVFMMGEGKESTPIAHIQGVEIDFSDRKMTQADVSVELEDDLYAPLYKNLIK